MQIRRTVREGFLLRLPRDKIRKQIGGIIAGIISRVERQDLADTISRSLWQFAGRQYEEWQRLGFRTLLVLASLHVVQGKRSPLASYPPLNPTRQQAEATLYRNGYDGVKIFGVPMQMYEQDYVKNYVKPALDRLCEQNATDPGDLRGRNSLRNRAEMEVRYQDHLDQIDTLRESGNRLVIASSHADCSKRCRPWQGRVYSLDGTSGRTDDGRAFVPLEEATDVFYTTKAGVTYKNGLLGFNCRHYLVPYKKGLRFPLVSEAEERKEYAISMQQRAFERSIRKWKIKEEMTRGIDPETSKKAKVNGREVLHKYQDFCAKHNRAVWQERTRLI